MSASFIASRLTDTTDPVARLRTAVEAYVLFAVEHPAAFRVMYAPYATVEESAPDLQRARSEGHSEMMGLIRAGQHTGVLRSGDPMQVGLALWSVMHGLSVLLQRAARSIRPARGRREAGEGCRRPSLRRPAAPGGVIAPSRSG